MRLRTAAVLVLLSYGLISQAEDRSSASASALLQSMAQAANMDVAGVVPWHWKMDIMIQDPEGNTPRSGTIEAWYADGNMRTSMTSGSEHLVLLRRGDLMFADGPLTEAFMPLQIVFMTATHPIPDTLLTPAVNLKLAKRKAGQVALMCVEPTFVLPPADTFVTGSLAYCQDEKTHHLLVSYQPNQNAVVRKRVGVFQQKDVPIELQIAALGELRISLTTNSLETFAPAPDFFEPGTELQPMALVVSLPQALQPVGLMLNKDAPHYPLEAKGRHAEGKVVFDTTIDADGKIASAVLTSKSDPSLVAATRDAMTHWIFRPFLLNGRAVPVKTTITMNFNLN